MFVHVQVHLDVGGVESETAQEKVWAPTEKCMYVKLL